MPGAFVEVWTLTKLWPMNFVPVMTLALLLQALLGVLFYKLLATLFGPRAGVLIPFAIFTMSPISLPAFLWWAASLNQLPQQIATVAALLCHVQYLRSGRVRRGVLGVGALAAGLLFSEKTLLAVPLVVAFTLAFAAGGSPWTRVRRAWIDHRPVWLAYLALVVPYTVYYLLAVPSPGRSAGTGGDLVNLGSRAVFDGILPGMLGGPWTWHPVGFAEGLAAPGSVAEFLSAVLIVVVIAATVAWNRASAGAWIIAAGFVLRRRSVARRDPGDGVRIHHRNGIPLLHRLRDGHRFGPGVEHPADHRFVRSRIGAATPAPGLGRADARIASS